MNKDNKLMIRIDDKTLEKLELQMKKYGLKSKSEYVRLLISIDVITNILEKNK